jgi:arsenate reductase (thioredoxin)
MKLLFLCTHNRCRSIVAEAVTRQIFGSLIEVQSAGSQPARKVHPLTLEHLALNDVPVRGLRAKPLESLSDYHPDFVITVCANAASENCPLWNGSAHRLHWGLMDPSVLDEDAVACNAAFASLIATLTTRMQRIKEVFLRTQNKEVLAEEFAALANFFVTANEPARRHQSLYETMPAARKAAR